MDFGALPPEVNSGRMYTGSGSGSMMAASTAWESLASELASSANAHHSVITGLASQPWQGPASMSMTAAAAPHTAWMHTTAEQARHAANQARAAAAAYEEAFAATVPPPVIATNRAELATLVATNLLGQNTPAIATNQAHYGEMWAQDAAAMYNYAGTTSAATTLTPFNEPRQNTNPGNQASAAAAQSGDGGSSAVPDLLQGLSSGGSLDPSQALTNMLTSTPVQNLLELNGNLAPVESMVSGLGTVGDFMAFGMIPIVNAFVVAMLTASQAGAAAAPVSSVTTASSGAMGSALTQAFGPASGSGLAGPAAAGGLGGSTMSAGLGRASMVGGLSVPQAWATPPVQLASAASPLATAGAAGLPEAGAGRPGGFGAIPPMGSVVNAPRNGAAGTPSRLKATAGGPNTYESIAGLSGRPDREAPNGRPLSTERDELNRLRRAVGQMSKERDTLKRSAAAMLLKDATQR